MAGEIRYADSNGVSIAYRVLGDGPSELVFVTGFVGHLEVAFEYPAVRRFFERLGSFSRVVIYDKRGQGLSDRPDHAPTLEESMDDLRSVIDATGLDRPAIFGISEGGPMAILFAASQPERVSSLVLYGTWPRVVRSADYEFGVDPDDVAGLIQLMREDWGGPVGVHLWAPSLAEDEAFRDWWARFLRSGTSPRGAMELLTLYEEIDVRHALPAIEAPTLVLHRDGDLLVPHMHGEYLAEHIPGARYVELSGADHLPFTEDADALLDEVEEFVVGTRSSREPERRLATVLFTDIVGSTDRAAAVGDRRWRDVTELHDDVVRKALTRHRGQEIKTMGDGFFASFDGPARAIRCAQQIVAEAERIGVQVRAGVHTGECDVVGNDLAGLAVNIGARVGAMADGGEVLVSQTVKDLVVGSGIEFEDRGTHTLKGVPGEWRLYASQTARQPAVA
jgi:pimeloyl-ACP methyl ester carboxylesterase